MKPNIDSEQHKSKTIQQQNTTRKAKTIAQTNQHNRATTKKTFNHTFRPKQHKQTSTTRKTHHEQT